MTRYLLLPFRSPSFPGIIKRKKKNSWLITKHVYLVLASATETARATNALLEFLDDHDFGGVDLEKKEDMLVYDSGPIGKNCFSLRWIRLTLSRTSCAMRSPSLTVVLKREGMSARLL